jgi:hypothetical protein
MKNRYIPQKSSDLIWRSIDDGTVIIDPDNGDIQVLNTVGARAWELVDGQRSIDQIAREITKEFEVSIEEAKADLDVYLGSLVEMGLIQLHDLEN